MSNTTVEKRAVAITIPPEYLPLLAIALATLFSGLLNSICVSVGYGYPYSTFLFDPADRFADFFKVALALDGPPYSQVDQWPRILQDYLSHNPYGGLDAVGRGQLSVFHIPPLSLLLYVGSRHLFSAIDPVVLFLILIVSIVVAIFVMVRQYLQDDRLAGIAGLSFLVSYPFLMVVTRGNIPAAIVGTALIGALISNVDRPNSLALTVLVALAINLRPNAAIFLGMFFLYFGFRRAVWLSVLALIAAFGLALILMYVAAALYPGYDLSTFLRALNVYYSQYAIGDSGIAFGSSLYGAFKMLISLPGNLVFGSPEAWAGAASIPASVRWVSFGLPMVFLLTAYCLRVTGRLSPMTFVFILCACYGLASIVFADYHLVVFFAVVLIGVKRLTGSGVLSAAESIALWSSVFVLSPKNFFYVGGVSLQVILNPLILTIATMSILWLESQRSRSQCLSSA